MYPLAILAGGMATRLYPITAETPKSMLIINGMPFIHWQLDLIAKAGFRKVVLCLGVKGSLIKDFVGDGSAYDLEIQYSFDGDMPLGTAGAIVKALPQLGQNFGVIYGDSYLPINYKKIEDEFSKQEKIALMTIYANQNALDRSNVEYSDNKLIRYSKTNPTLEMHYIDFGYIVLNSRAFSNVAQGSYADIGDIFEQLSINGELFAYEVSDRFYEIGSFGGIKDFTQYLEGEMR